MQNCRDLMDNITDKKIKSRINSRKHYLSHREEILERMRLHRLANIEKYRARNRSINAYPQNVARRKFYAKHTKMGRYISIKRGAEKRGLAFEISFEQFCKFWDSPCFYCGTVFGGAGLDRVDNGRGYFIDNVVQCCFKCNRMKWTSSPTDFIESCKLIVKNCGEKIRTVVL